VKSAYIVRNFAASSMAVIDTANGIIDEWQARGYTLTLRQLYYQFVARGELANTERNYQRLGSIVNDGRLAGLLDWDAIEDRTRSFTNTNYVSSDPVATVRAIADHFSMDRWKDQPSHIEAWVEKEALVGVIENVCQRWGVGYFACRGYASVSSMYEAARRLGNKLAEGKDVLIVHLGDHDPSGLDMTRDLRDRLELFVTTDWVDYSAWDERFELRRAALNMDQVEEYGPPPNPAKLTDSRSGEYVRLWGESSWELDALDPDVLSGLIEAAVRERVDFDAWQRTTAAEQRERELLGRAAESYAEIVDGLREGDG
jgi:hypothetical protein